MIAARAEMMTCLKYLSSQNPERPKAGLESVCLVGKVDAPIAIVDCQRRRDRWDDLVEESERSSGGADNHGDFLEGVGEDDVGFVISNLLCWCC